jgi:hypothetical protein
MDEQAWWEQVRFMQLDIRTSILSILLSIRQWLVPLAPAATSPLLAMWCTSIDGMTFLGCTLFVMLLGGAPLTAHAQMRGEREGHDGIGDFSQITCGWMRHGSPMADSMRKSGVARQDAGV